MIHVLIIEPDELQANGIRISLQSVNRNIWIATHLAEGIQAMKNIDFEFIITEISFPYMDMHAALEQIHQYSGAARLILISAIVPDIQNSIRAKYNIITSLEKPLDLISLNELLSAC